MRRCVGANVLGNSQRVAGKASVDLFIEKGEKIWARKVRQTHGFQIPAPKVVDHCQEEEEKDAGPCPMPHAPPKSYISTAVVHRRGAAFPIVALSIAFAYIQSPSTWPRGSSPTRSRARKPEVRLCVDDAPRLLGAIALYLCLAWGMYGSSGGLFLMAPSIFHMYVVSDVCLKNLIFVASRLEPRNRSVAARALLTAICRVATVICDAGSHWGWWWEG